MLTEQVEKTRAILCVGDNREAPILDFHGPDEDGLNAEVQLKIYRSQRLMKMIDPKREFSRLAKLNYLIFDASGEHGGTLDTFE